MAHKFNSAYRVHTILSDAASRDGGIQSLEVWKRVFGVAAAGSHAQTVAVTRHLANLHDEIGMVEGQLREGGYSPALFETVLNQAYLAVSAANLSNMWNSQKSYLQNDVTHSFLIYSEMLPVTEPEIAQAELDELDELIDTIEAQIGESGLPPSVQRFLREQLAIIRRARRDYEIQGIRAFQYGIVEIVAHKAARQPDVEVDNSSETMQGFARVLNKLKRVASITIEAERALTAGSKMVEIISEHWPT